DTKGFRNSLLETFKDLEQAGVSPGSFRKAAGKSGKLSELSAAYSAYRDWLADHGFVTESSLYQSAPVLNLNSEIFLYGFYDLTAAQKQFVRKLSPSTVFFPSASHNAYSEPLLDWFRAQDYKSALTSLRRKPKPATILSCPGETSEVQEAVREALAFVAAEGRSFNDVAILCRSREQYDAILRDTLASLGIRAYFRGGRPLSEQPDARLLSLLLATVRSDFSRASVMELACHTDSRSHWDALSVQLGIVGGQQQWIERLEAASCSSDKEQREANEGRHRERWHRDAEQVLAFVRKLMS